MSRPLSNSDPAFVQNSQEGNPGGGTAAKATSSIGNILYEAAQAGSEGNNITVTHQLVSPVAATNAEIDISGMTYTARSAGTSGNAITIQHTEASSDAEPASAIISDMTYSARNPGAAGNDILISHSSSAILAEIASVSIEGMAYSASSEGTAGNQINITHQLSPDVAATKASGAISGLTYEAKVAGAAGNSISAEVNAGSVGSAGSAELTRAFSTTGTASFSITDKPSYYGNPTTVKLTSTGVQLPISQLPAASASDSYFGNTSLLLRAGQGNIPSLAQNVTFVNSSSNASLLVLDRVGNVQQGSSSPHARPPGYWSVYFDGAGDSSTLPDNNVFTFDGNFTVEAWIRPAVSAASSVVAHWTTGVSTQCSFVLQLTVTGALRFSYGISSANVGVESAAGVIVPNQWTHVAVARVGSTLRLFANGQVVSTSSAVGSFNNSPNTLTIGRTTTDYFTGHISNLHLVKGTALYAANFTPSTSPTVAVSGTVLLTCQDNRFVDRSAVGSVLTIAGDTVVSATSPFAVTEYSPAINGASAYFDGASDYLVGAAGAGYDFGTSDFTVEAWVWWDGTYDSNGRIIYATATGGGPDQLGIFNSTGSPPSGGIFFSNTVASGVFPKINSWNHIAGTRSGTTVRIFLNGALVGSGTYALAVGSSTSPPKVGVRIDGSTNYHNWKGYISDLRVVKGTAVYTAAFSVPTSPLSAVSGTSLLLSCADASIADMTNTVDIETAGNIASSSAVTKFASKSMSFDGSGDYLSVGTIGQAPLSIGTGDFTIEAWIYPAATITGTPAIYANYGGSRTGAYLLRLVGSSGGKLALNVYPTGDLVTSTSNIAVGSWTHVAAVRSGGTLRLYVNGVLEASVANSTNLVSDPSHAATVGGYWQAAALEANGYFNGYIEDLRLTKATGRYSAPTSVGRSLNGTTEFIRFPTNTTVAQVLAVVGNSGTNPSSRVAITSSSSGTLSATDPSPNSGVTTSGGVAADPLSVSVTGTDIVVRTAGSGSTNAEVKTAIESNSQAAAIVAVSNPVAGTAATATKTFLSGGADAIIGELDSSISGNAITISVPNNTTNSALKTYLEGVEGIAGSSALINLSNPSGNAPTVSGPLYLSGGVDAAAGSLAASRSGTSITVSVPAGTSNSALKAYLESVANVAGVSGIIDLSDASGSAPVTSGPISLQGGTDAGTGVLDANVAGSTVQIAVPSGTSNADLKTYLEGVSSVAGPSGLLVLSGATGPAPTSSGPVALQGGTDEVPGQLVIDTLGDALVVGVPSGTSAPALSAAIGADAGASALVTATATDSGNASTTGSAQLAGGQD